jgi:hypothetical protein
LFGVAVCETKKPCLVGRQAGLGKKETRVSEIYLPGMRSESARNMKTTQSMPHAAAVRAVGLSEGIWTKCVMAEKRF